MNATTESTQLTGAQSLRYRRLVLLTHGVIGLATGVALDTLINQRFFYTREDVGLQAFLIVAAPVALYVWSAMYSWNLMYSWRFASNKRMRVVLFITVLIIGCAMTSSLIAGVGSLSGGELFTACVVQAIVNFYAAGFLLDVE
jgi:hypothetical protein